MDTRKRAAGLDGFKLIAALLVVTIHTSPLLSYSQTADFLLTRVAARVAVPFFLMVTGYFVLHPWLYDPQGSLAPIKQYLKKTALLYALSVALYFPLGLYAGHYNGLGFWGWTRLLFIDGTFYHLWYLPAALLGTILVAGVGKKLPVPVRGTLCVLLYAIGLLGDSYYGLASQSAGMTKLYQAGFQVFSYTRNGLFYAPIFLELGAWARQRKNSQRTMANKEAIGWGVSLAMMTGEALLLRSLGWQRHDSMYVCLVPCMYFLFQWLLGWQPKRAERSQRLSLWVYLLHPLCIVLVRALSRVTGLEVMVTNSVVHFALVCLSTLSLSGCFAYSIQVYKAKRLVKTRAWIELDKKALAHNVEALHALLPDDCELMPALKADAYGHGAVIVAKALRQMGIRAFCVATAEEGMTLRRHGVRGTILVLGYTDPAQAVLLRRYRLTQTVMSEEYAKALTHTGGRYKVHIKVDTGMHRLGERSENPAALLRICQKKPLNVQGLYTHLCTADSDKVADMKYVMLQAQRFAQTRQTLAGQGISIAKTHLLSSYGSINYPELGGDFARVGIALYGLKSQQSDWQNRETDLWPVLTLKAKVVQVKTLARGESAGYGLAFTAQRETRLAVLSIGYADGLPRALSCGRGSVLIHGCKAPIAGRLCMDQTLVDVTDIPDVRQGETAVLLGSDENGCITAYDWAEQTNSITNEVLSRLGPRLKREMVE